jgi:hypothetical protein
MSTVTGYEAEQAISTGARSNPTSWATDQESQLFAVKYPVTRPTFPSAATSHRSSKGVNHFDEDKTQCLSKYRQLNSILMASSVFAFLHL